MGSNSRHILTTYSNKFWSNYRFVTHFECPKYITINHHPTHLRRRRSKACQWIPPTGKKCRMQQSTSSIRYNGYRTISCFIFSDCSVPVLLPQRNLSEFLSRGCCIDCSVVHSKLLSIPMFTLLCDQMEASNRSVFDLQTAANDLTAKVCVLWCLHMPARRLTRLRPRTGQNPPTNS